MTQLICWMLMMSAGAACAASGDYDGTWAVTAQGKNILLIEIESDSDATVSGTLARPSRVQLSPQQVFTKVTGPEHLTALIEPKPQDDRLLFTASSPSDPNRRDRFAFTITSPTSAQLHLLDTPIPPLTLIRVDSNATLANDWDPELSYRMDEHVASNDELKRIYDADQGERAQSSKIDDKTLSANDAARRERVKSILHDGGIRTGLDFLRAAMIFQHGQGPEDFLLAHTLTMIALAKGNAEAIWLSSASLDRYLHAIGQPQIYGTQFRQDPGSPMSQGRFNAALISDRLRQQLGVPTIAEQAEQQRRLEEMLRDRSRAP